MDTYRIVRGDGSFVADVPVDYRPGPCLNSIAYRFSRVSRRAAAAAATLRPVARPTVCDLNGHDCKAYDAAVTARLIATYKKGVH